MTANSRTIEVSAADLPACCPPADGENWNLHPRVFLPLSASSPNASCPYCSANFALKSEESAAELEKQ